MNNTAKVVSSDQEELILVNSADEPVGSLPKIDCHQGDGILHRAFSVFIFNASGDVLLQKRSEQKMLWPMYWSNACCSHPRIGENAEEAAHRRIEQELNITTPLTFLYKFEYRANFQDVGSENELCWVWVGFAEEYEIRANDNEIAEWQFVSKEELDRELDEHPERYTPWMKMEWQRLFADHADQLSQ